MSAFWIASRVHRRDGVVVALPLAGGESRFLENGERLPDDDDVLWLGEAIDPPSDRMLPFEDLMFALWPANVEALASRIEKVASGDNRLDVETGLIDLAELSLALIAWWSAQDASHRAPHEAALRGMAPAWHALLQTLADESSLREGSFSGRDPRKLWPGLTFESRGNSTEPDAEAWRGWCDRDENSILGEHGGLRQLMADDFEVRQGQLDMAERVRRVLERGEHLMVEAGTGIGKSLAYLVPALLHGARAGERVVISTHTKALQEQLIDHDLPLLTRLGYPGTSRLLLGRSNYLCRRQLRRALAQRPRDAESALARMGIANWVAQSDQGRRVELAEHPWFEKHWRSFFESIEPCSPHICHPGPGCFVVRARRRAREAHVVVVNHSLLMMDLKSSQSLMGPSKLLIVDEAHQLGEIALHALSRWSSPERLDVYRNLAGDRNSPREAREIFARLLSKAEKLEEDKGAAALSACDRALELLLQDLRAWYDALEELSRERLGDHHHRPGRHRVHDAGEAFGPLRTQSEALFARADALDAQLASALATASLLQERGAPVDEEHEALASMLEFHRDYIGGLRFAIEADDEDWVYWLEWGGESGLSALVAAPLTVEEPFAELWDRHFESVIMTSATLSVAEDFLPFAESVGLSKVGRFTDSLIVPSPFDHRTQSLFLTSGDLLQPNDPHFAAQVAGVLAHVGRRVRTKALVLCTSYRFIDELAQALQAALHENELLDPDSTPLVPQILIQEPHQPRALLADRFRRADTAILLATGSFWEGVDFPGRELELLVVPRLPFAVPTDPLIEGRFERARRLGRDPFEDVALADAVLRLKQGVGRLLRSTEDRGVVLLLDQRLQAKSYGVQFLRSLPRSCEYAARTDEIGARVVEFLSRDPRARSARA